MNTKKLFFTAILSCAAFIANKSNCAAGDMQIFLKIPRGCSEDAGRTFTVPFDAQDTIVDLKRKISVMEPYSRKYSIYEQHIVFRGKALSDDCLVRDAIDQRFPTVLLFCRRQNVEQQQSRLVVGEAAVPRCIMPMADGERLERERLAQEVSERRQAEAARETQQLEHEWLARVAEEGRRTAQELYLGLVAQVELNREARAEQELWQVEEMVRLMRQEAEQMRQVEVVSPPPYTPMVEAAPPYVKYQIGDFVKVTVRGRQRIGKVKNFAIIEGRGMYTVDTGDKERDFFESEMNPA